MNQNISALTIYNGEFIAGGDFIKAGGDWQALPSGYERRVVMAPILKLDDSQVVYSGFPM